MAAPLLEVKHLKKYFNTPKGMLHAVDDVSFSIEKGRTMGVVGESGCGKSTLGRTIIHLQDSTDGQILQGLKRRSFIGLMKRCRSYFRIPFLR